MFLSFYIYFSTINSKRTKQIQPLSGTIEERGILAFNQHYTKEHDQVEGITPIEVYELPFGMPLIRKWQWARHIPFSPTYTTNRVNISKTCSRLCRKTSNGDCV